MNETQVVRTRMQETTALVNLIGKLDVSSNAALKVALAAALELVGITRVVLDWSELSYLDSTSQVALVHDLIKPARARNIEVVSIEESVSPHILKVWRMIGHDQLFRPRPQAELDIEI